MPQDQNSPTEDAPRAADRVVPHEETIGAIQGAPREVAEEYSRTGRTPRQYVARQLEATRDAEARGDEAKRQQLGLRPDGEPAPVAAGPAPEPEAAAEAEDESRPRRGGRGGR